MDIVLQPSSVVVLDLDDTLYSERDFLISGYTAVSMALGVADPVGLSAWMVARYDVGKEVIGAAIERSAREQGSTGLEFSEALRIYREHLPDLSLRPDARRFLDRLVAEGLPLALITDGRGSTQRNKLAALGIIDLLDPVCISEEIGVGKPNPTAFSKVMERYPGRAYSYIGDNPRKDFVAPNALGWQSICLLDDGKNIHQQDFTEAPDGGLPDHRVDSLDQILLPHQQ